MKEPIELYEELAPFFQSVDSTFEIELSGGVYLRFANSGKRGETKWFNLGLSEILTTLQDIEHHLSAFSIANNYEEKTWRDLGSLHFSDAAARSFITVQTKPVFTILSKIIHWSNNRPVSSYSDNHIDLSQPSLSRAIDIVKAMVTNLAPGAVAKKQASTPLISPPQPSKFATSDFRENFSIAISQVNFVNAGH